MPTKPEKDEVTGVETTGHEWDGIKELNTPLPRWWLWVLYATILFSILWWILYPAWPSHTGYTGGFLGSNQRLELEERVSEARAEQAVYRDRIAATEPAAILDRPELLSFAMAGGEVVYKENCAPCHGLGGAGQAHYPSLADDAWIWGGSPDAILHTIRHGVRHDPDPDTRFNMMPSYGVDGILSEEDIAEVTEYVLSLGGRDHDAELAEAGAGIFEAQCAACHGPDGTGMDELGAPNLTDQVWLYGGDREDIHAQIHDPRHGVMPAWQDRLSDEELKMVTLYVHTLGGGE